MSQHSEVCLDVEVVRAIEVALRTSASESLTLNRVHLALADILNASCETGTKEDQALARKILAALDEKGIPDALLTVSVRQGEARLYGVVPDLHGHRTVCDVTGQVPGVTAVHDHLVCIDPVTGAFMPSQEDSCS